MRSPESPILHSKIANSFRSLDDLAKRKQLRASSLSITTHDATPEQSREAFNQIKQLGFTPLKLYGVFHRIALIMHQEGIHMPAGKKYKQERGKITDEILNKMKLEETAEQTFYTDNINTNVFKDLENIDDPLTSQARLLSQDSMVLGRVLNKVREIASQRSMFALEENIPGQIPVQGPRILLQSPTTPPHIDLKRKADHTITTNEPKILRFGVLREVVRQGQLQVRREELEQQLREGKIIALPKFKLNNWPTDALMVNTRKQVAKAVDSYINNYSILCDPQDLKYQTLFRLTTYNLSDVYIGGMELDYYLQTQSVYSNWRNILNLDISRMQGYSINPSLLRDTIDEQYAVIKNRLQNSSLPLERIIPKSGIFAESGWVIQKRGNALFAMQEEGITASIGLVPLEFREIDPELAKQYHNDLHYIHTPRADIAFGLYTRGNDLPFSVLALEKIDRPYKQNVLLMQGYNPRFCYDLTRLYSRPGTPGNTSSSMFALTFNYMKNHYPETQAVMSAFMPSYATGVSMTSGGFENPILIKPLVHTFEERLVNDVSLWENVTKRRQQKSGVKTITSKFPLLPTVELMSSLQSPRYKPISELQDLMIEVN